MNPLLTTRIVLASRPQGAPVLANFRLERVPVPATAEGQVLVQTLFLSLDPYMRGRMDDGPSYAAPVALGAVMEGGTVSTVLESRHADYRAGDVVLTHTGWQTHAVIDGSAIRRKLDPSVAPVSTALGVYGMPGFTAFVGLREIGRPQPGETLVVAAASGPVGATVGQIGRRRGARVVGIAGGEAKRRYLQDELGFDVALDHRAADFAQQLATATPQGIDVYFENVGGPVFAAVLPRLNDFARIPVCGLVAHYNEAGAAAGPDRLPDLMRLILRKHLTVRGFIQRDFVEHYPEFLREMGAWLRAGQIVYREDIVQGLEQAPAAFIGLLKGANFGKLLIQLS